MNLIVRTMSKPIISWVTYHKKIKLKEPTHSKNQIYFRKKLMQIGQSWNYYNVLINRKLFKMSYTNSNIPKLSEDIALERGAEIISEIVIYTVLLSIPIFEWYRLSKIQREKKRLKDLEIMSMKMQLEEITSEAKIIDKEIKRVKLMIAEFDSVEKVNNFDLIDKVSKVSKVSKVDSQKV